jgi:PIN domain nuclease of toxin-antitoxin system
VKLLLDTHVLLWWLFDDRRLSGPARKLIESPDNVPLVSAASAWEIATKFRLGRLPDARRLVDDFGAELTRAQLSALEITCEHAILAGSYKNGHRDPFDRMIAAQAQIESLSVISKDPELQAFPINLVW